MLGPLRTPSLPSLFFQVITVSFCCNRLYVIGQTIMYWPYLIYEHTWLGVTFTLLNFVRLEGLAMQDILAVKSHGSYNKFF